MDRRDSVGVTPASAGGLPSQDAWESVRVVARIRPLVDHEIKRNDAESLSCGRKDIRVKFDNASDRDGDQLLDNVLDGYAATVFAYGQTGSGKTYSMSGPEVDRNDASESERDGIIQRSVRYLFSKIAGMEGRLNISVRASFSEIYKEQVNDLLNSDQTGLPIRWTQNMGFFVENLTVVMCDDMDDLTMVVSEGLGNRKVASHEMNRDSSRSHAILTLYIDTERVPDATEGYDMAEPVRHGKISFVDLAGSERVKETKSTGEMLIEATNINRSLFTLGKVISALGSAKINGARYVPYRDSKLTKLLMDSLGGSSMALMFANVSPSARCVEESLRTLKYGMRAQNIKNSPVVKVDPQSQLIERLMAENAELKRRLAFYESGQEPPSQNGGETPGGGAHGVGSIAGAFGRDATVGSSQSLYNDSHSTATLQQVNKQLQEEVLSLRNELMQLRASGASPAGAASTGAAEAAQDSAVDSAVDRMRTENNALTKALYDMQTLVARRDRKSSGVAKKDKVEFEQMKRMNQQYNKRIKMLELREQELLNQIESYNFQELMKDEELSVRTSYEGRGQGGHGGGNPFFPPQPQMQGTSSISGTFAAPTQLQQQQQHQQGFAMGAGSGSANGSESDRNTSSHSQRGFVGYAR